MFFKAFENDKPVGYLILEENLQHVLVDVDFDKNPPPKFFESLGYAVVIPAPLPAITPYQTVEEIDCVQNEDGTWTQQWQVNEVDAATRKEIFDKKLKEVTDHQDHLLGVYAQQLKDPNETPDQIEIINKFIDATKAMDVSDPFNVVWPTEESVLSS